MTIHEIYVACKQAGCLSFSTLTKTGIASRIAHFFADDEEGLYLRTMEGKPFYAQLKEYGQLSACGMYPSARVEMDAEGLPHFPAGYTIRVSGSVREITSAEIEEKAATNEDFRVASFDIKKYPATRVFVLYEAAGEHYDYDFEMERRDHKLLRTPFAFGGARADVAGFSIDETCIACGLCREACTFKAIEEGAPYVIDKSRCDECSSCRLVCPVDAISLREGER